MPIPQELWLSLLEAIGFGLGLAVILGLLGRYALVRRTRVSLLLSAILAGVYLVLTSAGLAGDSPVVKIVVAAALRLGAYALLQLFDALLWDYVLARRRHLAVPRLLVDVFNFLVLTAIGLAVLNLIFQVELSALLVTSTVVSAVIGLSLQDLLGSVVAGLALQLEQPFRVGDWVRLSEQEGQVTQMNWRTLTLRTRDNHHLILPNASVARQDITNYSRPTPLQRQHVQVGVAYGHPPGVVKTVLAHAAAASEGVVREPAPEAAVTAYGDFAVQYDIRYWIDDYAHAEQIHDRVMTRLWYELRRANLTIPFPVREVTMRALPEDHAARAQEQLRREVFAELRPLAVFMPLSDAQIEQVVRGAALQRYSVGEALVRQGEPGDSLFVIKAGRVRIDVKNELGQVITVDHLGPDDFFGEMSLLTGEPRAASVIAETETEVIVVDKSDLAEVFKTDTALLESISLVLEQRVRRSAERVAAGSGPLMKKESPQQLALLQRIRGFFGVKPQ